jgi:hypothetical protein
VTWLIFAAVLSVTSLAYADGTAAAAQDIVTRSLLLRPGEVELGLNVELGLDRSATGQQQSFAPDFRVGILPRLTLGVVHSHRAVERIDAGAGVCLNGVGYGCIARYQHGGVEARYRMHDGGWLGGHSEIAARGGLLFRQFSPLKPAALVGATLQWQRSRWLLTSDPYIQLGAGNNDRGNRSSLHVPLWVSVQPTCRWMISLRTGFDSDFAVIGDGWHGVVGGAVKVVARPNVDVEISGGFRSGFGPQNTSSERSIALAVVMRAQ